MNLELLNPFNQDVPESVDVSLDAGALCARFNSGGLFAGQFLAAGRHDGTISIIDTETRSVVHLLEGHVKAVTAVCWSRRSRYLLSASRDWNVIIWDLSTGDRRETIRFDAPVTSASLHPRNSKLLVVTLQGQAEAVYVDLRSVGGRWELDIASSLLLEGDEEEAAGQATRRREAATICRFNPRGDLIYVGSSLGSLYIFETRTKLLVHKEKIAGNSTIKDMEFDRRGSSIAFNSNDRTIRIYSIDQASGSLVLQHRFVDLVNRTPWNGCGFSADGEYVLGGAGHKASHNVHVWDRGSGALVKILEGPPDPLVDFDWHPNRPIVASVSNIGLIHIWVTGIVEHWAAYAPGFEELEENAEYAEREDEFDLEDEEALQKREQDKQDVRVDLFTAERAQTPSAFPDDFADVEPDDDDRDDFFPTPLDVQEAFGDEVEAQAESNVAAAQTLAQEQSLNGVHDDDGVYETSRRRR